MEFKLQVIWNQRSECPLGWGAHVIFSTHSVTWGGKRCQKVAPAFNLPTGPILCSCNSKTICLSLEMVLHLSWTLLFDLSGSEQPTCPIRAQTYTYSSAHGGGGLPILCVALADITRDSTADLYPMWTRLNHLTHTLWRQMMVHKVRNRGCVLHLSTSGWWWALLLGSHHPLRASFVMSRRSMVSFPQDVHTDRAASPDCQNDQWTLTQCSSNGCLNQKEPCNAAPLDSWWNHSHLFWTNFLNSCKYVSESISPNNIQSLEDSHQST